ncbi:sensor histidine kinase [Autumnicola musiva]|uniref:Sensor histidine kinase n=1 Tax=Autumnicola musiva TaxID=3075589 RepID=A0ABU3D1M6_9FLAO|nr:sensor histidine kinase [Zunongwangia sp. F117]MDT0675446.1 sensor histidine kinase [Zunongwangia sp. F117]
MATHKFRKNFLSFPKIVNYEIKPSHHVIFWSIYFLINTLRWGSYYEDYILSLKGNMLGFPIHMFLCYVTIYFLIPKFIYKKFYILFSTSLFLLIFCLVIVKFELTYFLINNNVWPEGPETNNLTVNYMIQMMLGELYVISFVTSIKITIDYLSTNRKAAKLEQSKLETELRFLRSQISPHFFFNTLNNIYSLSLEKSEKAPDVILKLSELMRYLLYETKNKQQSLEKEILCIQNYLDLERIRHGENLDIKMEISGGIIGKKVAPMLLIPFVENAFKHGINANIGEVFVNINIKIEEEFLYFDITNPITKSKSKRMLKDNNNGGIGISNVRKRLELGYSQNEYDLKIFEKDNLFQIFLKIKLR